MSQWTLTALDVRGPTRWYWRLTEDGVFLADFSVELDDRCWQYKAYLDLHGYLRRHASPDRRGEDERRIIGEVGRWIGREVLGPIGPRLVQAARDANRAITVHVTVEASGDSTRSIGRRNFAAGCRDCAKCSASTAS